MDSTFSRRNSLWRAALIAGTGIMLLIKVAMGTLPLYVHVRYTPLIAATGALLLGLALMQGWRALRPAPGGHPHEHDHDPATLSWRSPAVLAMLVPIVLGLAVPSRALGSAAIDTRGFGTGGSGIRTVQSIAGPSDAATSLATTQWTLLDWVNGLIYQPDNPRLQGQPIETVGFVWRSDEMPPDMFYVSRFVVSCCTADSLAIYLPVLWPESAALPQDSWVRVRGTIGLAEVLGEQSAVIRAEEIIPIPQPAEPYLYP